MGQKKKKQINIEGAVCQKNDVLELRITDLGTDGEGIGRTNGYALFVKGALPGELVQVLVMKTKKNYGFARLQKILEPSPDRVMPVCEVAGKCGGCQLQHLAYPAQLAFKTQKVKACLERIGGLTVEPEPILSMKEPYHYRNKAQFPVGYDKEGNLIAGFYAGRTHSIIPCEDCAILHPVNRPIVQAVLAFMDKNHIPAYDEQKHKGLVRHILIRVGKATGEVMLCMIINGIHFPKPDEFVKELLQLSLPEGEDGQKFTIKSICLNENTQKTNVILGEKIKVLYGQEFIEDYIGNVKFQISPLSFYQVNPEQTRKLYETALEYADLQGGEVVWDLYCGIGTISLFLAQKASRVCGVEIVPQAIEDARKNARLNHMENTEFFVGAAEDVVPEIYEKSGGKLKADVVTLDPPRKGCDEKLLQTVVHMEPEKIVYVSCDPATLARDLKFLTTKGYEVKKVRACDMFGMSGHVETVVLMSRKDK